MAKKINLTSKTYINDFVDWFSGVPIEKVAEGYHSAKTLEASFKQFKETERGKNEIDFIIFKKRFLEDEQLRESIYTDYENNYKMSEIIEKYGSSKSLDFSRLLNDYAPERMYAANKKRKSLSNANQYKKSFDKIKTEEKKEKTRCNVHWVYTQAWA